MSRDRIRGDSGWGVAKDHPRGPNGRLMCRKCLVEVPKGRQTFCSDECVHRWKIETQPPYVRRQVFKRDRGVCAACGLDTEALRKSFPARPHQRGTADRAKLVELGFRATAIHQGDFWQADHTVAVAEGGGGCGLDGYRTLCTPCHKRVTAELIQRLKETRRLAKEAAAPRLFEV